jgi:hypothetical protein
VSADEVLRNHRISLLVVGCVLRVGLSDAVAGSTIPLSALAGMYTITGGGTYANCYSGITPFPEIPFSSFDQFTDFYVPLKLVSLGEYSQDFSGNTCGWAAITVSDLPVDPSPPFTATNFFSVGKLISYSPLTGTGSASITNYFGGSCTGATFNPTGATKTGTATSYFIASNGGYNSDFIITADQDLVGGVGDFEFKFEASRR